MVLGVNPKHKYKEREFSLETDDNLFLCSDGVYPVGHGAKHYSVDDFKEAVFETIEKKYSLEIGKHFCTTCCYRYDGKWYFDCFPDKKL